MTRLNPKRNNLLVPITIAVLVIAVIALAVWQRNRVNTVSASATTFDLTGRPTVGPAGAKVTVVTFEDFKCPNCKRYDETVFPQVKQNYIDTGKIRYAFFNFPLPLGEDSYTAAVAAECVYTQSPDLFWRYKDVLFRGQKDETTTWATPAYLTELAGLVDGIDTNKLGTCLNGNDTRARVDADRAVGMKAGVNSTPNVFVNGQRVESPDYPSLSAAIDAALK